MPRRRSSLCKEATTMRLQFRSFTKFLINYSIRRMNCKVDCGAFFAENREKQVKKRDCVNSFGICGFGVDRRRGTCYHSPHNSDDGDGWSRAFHREPAVGGSRCERASESLSLLSRKGEALVAASRRRSVTGAGLDRACRAARRRNLSGTTGLSRLKEGIP